MISTHFLLFYFSKNLVIVIVRMCYLKRKVSLNTQNGYYRIVYNSGYYRTIGYYSGELSCSVREDN